jgi:hypothetical protein
MSSFLSQHLLVCNLGATTGATSEDLVSFFGSAGAMERVTIAEDKSFSFVSYVDAAAAREIYDRWHDRECKIITSEGNSIK